MFCLLTKYTCTMGLFYSVGLYKIVRLKTTHSNLKKKSYIVMNIIACTVVIF